MRLVVGLGNPGGEYRFTRHNAGFLTVDLYLARQRKKATQRFGESLGTKLILSGEEVWFLKPQTFMNRSGQALVPFAREQGIAPNDTLVLHDEADFDEGRIALKKGGGDGGHNGLESVLSAWGEDGFYRLRIGVGKDPDRELADYVLEDVGEMALKPTVEKAADALERVFALGADRAMAEINRAAPVG